MYGPLGTYDGGREKAPAALCRKIINSILNQKDAIDVWGDGNQYAVTSIPLDIRDKYMDDYYKFGNFMDKEFTEWEKLYNYLKEMPFDEKLHNEMMKDIQLRDKHRGTCLTDIFPEWEPYYEKL